eukprot:GHVS01107290.1.p2 GENE.GHVS01107290.1~~GHVS01107290.1.p2  ORF type:complete len:105 (+),score=26.45 GHVS01107290.1:231-545(+)
MVSSLEATGHVGACLGHRRCVVLLSCDGHSSTEAVLSRTGQRSGAWSTVRLKRNNRTTTTTTANTTTTAMANNTTLTPPPTLSFSCNTCLCGQEKKKETHVKKI